MKTEERTPDLCCGIYEDENIINNTETKNEIKVVLKAGFVVLIPLLILVVYLIYAK
jgi:hypothetical protein